MARHFNVFIVDGLWLAETIVSSDILPGKKPATASWAIPLRSGPSASSDWLRGYPAIPLIEAFVPDVPRKKILKRTHSTGRIHAILINADFEL